MVGKGIVGKGTIGKGKGKGLDENDQKYVPNYLRETEVEGGSAEYRLPRQELLRMGPAFAPKSNDDIPFWLHERE